ncbi:hypothetical protein Hanom_Chr06g00539491 [Helianthus anomalus]
MAKFDDLRWRNDFARYELRQLSAPFDEAERANRWDPERECYLDPQGNPLVDPEKVDFNALLAVIPTCGDFYTRRVIEKDYDENLDKRIKELFYSSLTKVMELKKKKEEVVEKIVEEVKKIAGEVGDESQQKVDKRREIVEEGVITEKIQTESSESSNTDKIFKQSDNKIEEQCRKCMETCRACGEKDEKLKSRDIEVDKNEIDFKKKKKSTEIIENEEVLKQNVENLTLKCQEFEKENEISKQKCSQNVMKKIISFKNYRKNMIK